MGSNSEELPGLNLLSLDEGGITGLSSLFILRDLMTRLQEKSQLPERPEPYEHFDLIAGTGTGAISAIMLGRLRITLDDAIDRYISLMSNGFFRKFISHESEAFKATKLEEALRNMVVDADKLMMEENPKETRCKVVIYAMSAHSMRAGLPCAFRTYPSNTNVMPDCQIWKALRASTAHPLRFKGVEIEELGVKCRFIGGMFGCSNPTVQLLDEASRLFPRRFLSSVTSIGSGSARTIQILQSNWFERLFLTSRALKAALDIATDNEGVANVIGRRFTEVPNVYYRLNVDIDVQSDKASKRETQSQVAGHTATYLRQPTTQRLLDSLVESIARRAAAVPVTYIDGRIVVHSSSIPMGLKYCPFVTFMFKGRTLQIDQIVEYFGNEEAQHVFVLYGPGGAGKTQLALKYAESKARAQGFEGVLFIDGSSRASIETALIQFAVAEDLGQGQSYSDTLESLGSKGRWLMLFDNVEGPKVQVEMYYPQNARFDVLITTRHQEIVSLARGQHSSCKIEGMDEECEEALDLLLEASNLRKDALQTSEITEANDLLKKLGYLALAIVQCGAYICWKKCSISQYCETYNAFHERRETLEESGPTDSEVNDYGRSVQLTWKMNNELIGLAPKKIWHLIAFLGRNGISEEIFQRAYMHMNGQDYQPQLPLSDSETEAQIQVKDALKSFTLDGVWNSRLFLSAMSELVGLSLVTFDTVNNKYQVHPLVQGLARATIPKSNSNSASYLLAASINRNGHNEDLTFTRAMAPHVKEVVDMWAAPNPNDAWQFVAVYQAIYDHEKATEMRTLIINSQNRAIGEDYPSQEVGATSSQDQMEETPPRISDVQEPVIESKHNTADDAISPHDEAEGMHTLATTSQDRMEETPPRISDVQEPVLESKHNTADDAISLHDEAEGMHTLAATSQELVVEEDHPCPSAGAISPLDRTKEMHSQSPDVQEPAPEGPHSDIPEGDTVGPHDEAEGVYTLVVDAQGPIGEEEYPSPLVTAANTQDQTKELGYQISGVQGLGLEEKHLDPPIRHIISSHDEVEKMDTQVVDASRPLVEKDCPKLPEHRSGADSPFGRAEGMLAQVSNVEQQALLLEVEALELQTIDAQKRALGEDHPETLQSMANLAATYTQLGKLAEAQLLGTEVLASRTQVLGLLHPDTVQSMRNLAQTYQALGQKLKYEALMTKADAIETN